eukprot:GHVR01145890.1.p2 GENE.GHVR01145890.1~~GHVR01145890.1.p2  ORF type:complete len:126 (+),score=11.90 GHVR01145890.1:1336-1713(+)
MTVSTLALYSQQENGVTFADPLDPDMTVRFKTNSSQKNLDGKKVVNYVTDIVANDQNMIALGNGVYAQEVNDSLSVRIRVSGAVESIDRLKEMIENLTDKLVNNWLDENVLTGFAPTTPPINGTP